MSKVFLIDVNKCNGCHNCQIACKDEHCGQPWLPIADEQPLTGQFWCKVDEKVRGQVPVVRLAYQPKLCGHCEECAVMKVGGDAVYRREDGLVIIDPEKAKGMKELVEACPMGAVYYNEELGLPQKCTGCAHLLDNGWETPRCVDSCATEALLFVDESEIDLSVAETLPELEGMGAKVYYLNLPKRFIAGAVVDLEADELVIGAEVKLLDAEGAQVAVLTTDEFGDFKFDQIEKGAYTVVIGELSLAADVTEQDLCLGDIAI